MIDPLAFLTVTTFGLVTLLLLLLNGYLRERWRRIEAEHEKDILQHAVKQGLAMGKEAIRRYGSPSHN